MIDFVEYAAAESERFQRAVVAIATAGGDEVFSSVSVPSCPDWTAADLTWHLAEVQYFWASIVEGNLANYSAVQELSRPADDQLLSLAAEQADRLITHLSSHGAGEPCWSWHDDGHSVGWVRRRQAHEALIHRIDAELTLDTLVPGSRTAVDEILATDGIDEMLRVILGASSPPDWATFNADGTTVRIEVPGRSWSVALGRYTGTDEAGTPHDDPALLLTEPTAEPSATITGPASEIDLWLWRRGPLADGAVEGDMAVVERLQALAAVQ